MHLSQSTGALRQARAGSKGEARGNLRSAPSDLQYLIKNFRKKYLFLLLRRDFSHGIGPFGYAPVQHKSVHTQSYSRNSRQGSQHWADLIGKNADTDSYRASDDNVRLRRLWRVSLRVAELGFTEIS